jgi:crossover junction endodeoxyribonuclease RusA
MIEFELPWPPSINNYYKRVLRGVVINEKGVAYRRDVKLLLAQYVDSFTLEQRLNMTINVFPPDKRGRDLDNLLKASIDAMQHARVFPDDKQIDKLAVIRQDIVKPGKLQVWISECDQGGDVI